MLQETIQKKKRNALESFIARLLASAVGRYVAKIILFGSVAKNDADEESDVDVLVEFLPGHTPGFFSLFDMEEELSGLFGGHKVDLRTPEDLSRYFRQDVINTAEVQYVQ